MRHVASRGPLAPNDGQRVIVGSAAVAKVETVAKLVHRRKVACLGGRKDLRERTRSPLL